MSAFNMYTCILPVPTDMDPSDLLERLQELAAELAEENPGIDNYGEEEELTEAAKEAISNEVSVQEVPGVTKYF